MRFAVICLILLLMAVIGNVTAEDQSVPDGTIYGHVYDAQTKQPVSGAWVYCQENKCTKQLTDSDGYYAIENCFSPSSTYYIQCTKNGYPTAKNTAQTDSSGKAKVDFNLDNAPSPPPKPESNQAQSKSWKKTFGGPADDFGYSVKQTSDGGYMVAGRTWSYGAGKGDGWLIKTDADGNKIWDKFFGGSNDDDLTSVQQTSDGGYIAAGTTLSYGSSRSAVLLIKTDSLGNEIWDRTFGGQYNDAAASVQQTTDDGYIIFGSKGTSDVSGGYIMEGSSFRGAGGDVWLIKTDADGNKQWDRTFGGSNDDWSRDGQQTSDGGYIIIGGTDSYGAGDRDIWLIKTDASGNKLWEKTFGGSSIDEGYSVQQTSDGGYILTGFTVLESSHATNFWLIKTDANGNKLWDEYFERIGWDFANAVKQTNDGGYILTGWSGSDVWLIKTDANGNRIWDRIFSGGCGESVQQTSDVGFIITGYNNSPSADKKDVWLIKTDSEGN